MNSFGQGRGFMQIPAIAPNLAVSQRNGACRRFCLSGLLVCVVLFAAAAFSIGQARAPWWDEGAFADSAYNMAFHGVLGSTTWHPVIFHLPDFVQIDRYTYWTVPLYSVTLAGWFFLAGFSLASLHLYSLLWGVVLLVAVYATGLALTGSHPVGLLAATLTAADTAVAFAASDGRPDCMSAALGMCAVAAYLTLGERSFRRALFLSVLLAGLAVITHPIGVVAASVLFVAVLMQHRARLRMVDLGVAALAAALPASLWGSYIAKAPDVFSLQFFTHLGARFQEQTSLAVTVARELTVRYFAYYSAGPAPWAWLRLLTPAAVVAALVYLAFLYRGSRQKTARLAVALTTAALLSLAVIDHTHHATTYLVHVVPLSLVLCAVAVWCLGESHRRAAQVCAAGLCLLILMGFGIHAYKARDFRLKREYDTAVGQLRQLVTKDSLVMGPSQLMFGLDRKYRLVDDPRLGFYSHLQPDLILQGPDGTVPGFFRDEEPQVTRFMNRLLYQQSTVVFKNEHYTIYRFIH